MSERSLHITAELGRWSAIVTIMAVFGGLAWITWPSPGMMLINGFLAGIAFERMRAAP